MTTATKYKTYSKYKPSGVEWIGSVPEHWELSQVKNVCSFEKGQGLSKGSTDITGMNKCILYGELFTTYKKTIVINSIISRTDEKGSMLSKGNEILIPGSTTTTGVDLSNAKYLPLKGVILGGDIIVLYPKKPLYSQQFLALFLTYVSTPEFIVGANGVTIYHIYPAQIREMFVAFPPISEQKKIIIFLDHEMAKIDKMVAKKQKMIELLKEKRQALIMHAVTKGLDPKVKKKPSGIDWLGDIPEGWEIKRLRFVSNYVKTGSTPDSEQREYFDSGTIPWFTPGDFNEKIDLDDASKTITEKAITDGEARLFKKDSILLVGIGATLGKIGFCKTKFSSNQQINVIYINNQNDPRFYAYYLLAIADIVISTSNASTLGILNQEKTKQILCVVPPKQEQVKIVEFIDEQWMQFDKMMKKVENQIEKLQEYRQALITSAVTGKIMIN